jgi:hypothetical protein
MMNQEKKKKPRFKKNESGFHESAKKILAEWVNGLTEQEFYLDSEIAFVPDVTCKESGRVNELYEVYHTHPLNGKKLAMMQAWGYFNGTGFTVFEVDADFILKQTEKPGRIRIMEMYEINPIL